MPNNQENERSVGYPNIPPLESLVESSKIGKPNDEMIKRTGFDFEKYSKAYVTPAIEELEDNTGISFTESERDWLDQFARFSYRLDMYVTNGKYNQSLARAALGYTLTEAYIYKKNDQDITEAVDSDRLDELTEQKLGSDPDIPVTVGDKLGLILPSQDGSDYTKLIQDFHRIRQTLNSGEDYREVTLSDPFFSNVMPIYVIAKNMTRRNFDRSQVQNTYERDELENTARSMMMAEGPSAIHSPNYLQFRESWSRLSVLAADYWLRDVNWPAFVAGNWSLNEATAANDYSDRWEQVVELSMDDFCSECELDDHKIAEARVPKGVLSTLQKVLDNDELLQSMNDVLDIDYSDRRLRLQMFGEIVEAVALGTLSDERFTKANSIVNKVHEAITGMEDVARMRLTVNNGQLDNLAQSIVKSNPKAVLILEKGLEDKSEVKKIPLTEILAEGESPESVIDNWIRESAELSAQSNFGAIFVHKQVRGINSELQLEHEKAAVNNLQSRRRYKSITAAEAIIEPAT